MAAFTDECSESLPCKALWHVVNPCHRSRNGNLGPLSTPKAPTLITMLPVHTGTAEHTSVPLCQPRLTLYGPVPHSTPCLEHGIFHRASQCVMPSALFSSDGEHPDVCVPCRNGASTSANKYPQVFPPIERTLQALQHRRPLVDKARLPLFHHPYPLAD